MQLIAVQIFVVVYFTYCFFSL